jgi:hypothetical protein
MSTFPVFFDTFDVRTWHLLSKILISKIKYVRFYLTNMYIIRVTRLGDFLLIVGLFTLGSFFEKYRSNPNLGLNFSRYK